MSNNTQHGDIVKFIEALHASRHLVAEAYCDGSLDYTDENTRSLRQLQELRVMRSNVNRENSLRLSTGIVKLLDQVVNRVRTMQTAGNLSDQMGRLHNISESYLRACYDNHEDNQEIYSSDFDMAAYELYDHVEEMIMHVDIMANNNFANVSSYPEKIRQNEHYLKQMKRLVDTLGVLMDQGLMDTLESCRELQPLMQQYELHILKNMNTWRAKLHDIIGLLERYMSKMREIEPYAKRIRMFSVFLHRNPDYAPKDPDDYAYIPEWAFRHNGITLSPSPDMLDEDTCEGFIPLAQTIERGSALRVRERKAGVLDSSAEDLEQVVIVEPTPFDLAIYDLVDAAKRQPGGLSAKSFFLSHEQSKTLDPAISLMCLTALLYNTKRCERFGFDDLHFSRQDLVTNDTLSGNITVMDYLICQKA